MTDFIANITEEELRLAAGAIRRGGPVFSRWMETLTPEEAWAVGCVFGAIVAALGIVSPESGPSSKTH